MVCEPDEAPMLSSGIEQQRNADGSAGAGHPSWKPHPMQGWSPDFIAKLAGRCGGIEGDQPGIADCECRCAEVEQGTGEEGRDLCGDTSGATFAGALQVAAQAPKGATILCMLPDTGERYLSTPLFAEVSADMNEEEWEIARSTPGCILEPAK